MAQFTAKGVLKLLFNGDGASFAVEPSDPFHYKLGGGSRTIQVHKRKLAGSASRVFSLHKKKPSQFGIETGLNGRDKGMHDGEDEFDGEDEYDELACFRGLVLDISYRHVISITHAIS